MTEQEKKNTASPKHRKCPRPTQQTRKVKKKKGEGDWKEKGKPPNPKI